MSGAGAKDSAWVGCGGSRLEAEKEVKDGEKMLLAFADSGEKMIAFGKVRERKAGWSGALGADL